MNRGHGGGDDRQMKEKAAVSTARVGGRIELKAEKGAGMMDTQWWGTDEA